MFSLGNCANCVRVQGIYNTVKVHIHSILQRNKISICHSFHFISNSKSVITWNIYEVVNYNQCRDSHNQIQSIWFIPSSDRVLSCVLVVTTNCVSTRTDVEFLTAISSVHTFFPVGFFAPFSLDERQFQHTFIHTIFFLFLIKIHFAAATFRLR